MHTLRSCGCALPIATKTSVSSWLSYYSSHAPYTMHKIETICCAFRSFLTMRDNSGRMAIWVRHKFHWRRIRLKYMEKKERRIHRSACERKWGIYKSLSFPKISWSVTIAFSMYFFTHFVLSSAMEKTSFFNLYIREHIFRRQWKFIDDRLVFLSLFYAILSHKYWVKVFVYKKIFCLLPFPSFFFFCFSFHFLKWNESIPNELDRDSFQPSSYSLHPPLYVSIYSCARVASILQKERNVIWDFRVGMVRLKGSCKIFAWVTNKVSHLQHALSCFVILSVIFYVYLHELIRKWLDKKMNLEFGSIYSILSPLFIMFAIIQLLFRITK